MLSPATELKPVFHYQLPLKLPLNTQQFSQNQSHHKVRLRNGLVDPKGYLYQKLPGLDLRLAHLMNMQCSPLRMVSPWAPF